MSNLNEEDIEKIAEKLYEKVEAKGRSFWIEPEKHYQAHEKADKLIEIWDSTQSAFIKTLIGLFIVGMLLFASMPIWLKKFGA